MTRMESQGDDRLLCHCERKRGNLRGRKRNPIVRSREIPTVTPFPRNDKKKHTGVVGHGTRQNASESELPSRHLCTKPQFYTPDWQVKYFFLVIPREHSDRGNPAVRRSSLPLDCHVATVVAPRNDKMVGHPHPIDKWNIPFLPCHSERSEESSVAKCAYRLDPSASSG